MQGHGFLRLGGILFVVSQMLGPGTVGAAESQRPPKSDTPRRAMVSGLRGDAQILSPGSTEPRPVRFRDAVNSGDQLTTGPGNLVEILVGRHALVTLHEESSLQFLEEAPGQTALQLIRGEARLAVARAEDTITIQTPTATAATRGGLIRVKVTPGKRQASQHDNDEAGHSIPIVFRNVVPIAAAVQAGPIETFQVSEGAIQVKSSAPGSPLTTLEAGQNVQVTAGQIGKPSAAPPAPAEKYSLPAAETHSRTSEAGIRNLVGQQRQQAEGLQRVLLGPTDTERPLAKNAATGAIISTTGVIISTTGVALTQS
ncbi:MAG: FecR domain-containing protein, partial [Nitrospiraceae bacterium]